MGISIIELYPNRKKCIKYRQILYNTVSNLYHTESYENFHCSVTFSIPNFTEISQEIPKVLVHIPISVYLKCNFTKSIFMKLVLPLQFSVKNNYIDFYENPTKG